MNVEYLKHLVSELCSLTKFKTGGKSVDIMTLEKKKRARTPAAMQKQRELIINTGRKHFLKFGSQGMSMRALAKELGMGSGKSASSLYTYVKSKRELWFLIMRTLATIKLW